MSVEPFHDTMPEVAADAFVHASAVLMGMVTIGSRSTVWPNSTLRGDDGRIIVGECTSIQDGAVLHCTDTLGDVVIGDRCTIGHNAIIHGATVEDDCLIGMGSILLDDAVIGKGSYVGAGSLVTQGVIVPPGSLVFGSPAKVIRPVRAKEADWIVHSWQHYLERGAAYLALQRRD